MTTEAVRAHFDRVAAHDAAARRAQEGFHARLAGHLAHRIPAGESVLEWGCGSGELLARLRPDRALGIDLSPAMIERARARALPGVRFETGDLHAGSPAETFDHIILDYLCGYLRDIQACLRHLHASAHPRTRLHLVSLNTLWKPVLAAAARTGRVMPQPPSAWLADSDLVNLLELAGWEVLSVEHWHLLPARVPGLDTLANDVAVRLPLLRHLGCSLAITARPRTPYPLSGDRSCTVVVPARNEEGNIPSILGRIPVLGNGTEVVFVEGNSTDGTWDAIQRAAASHDGPHRVRALRQPGRGKWDAVRTGFEAAGGDVLAILDADLTAPPEDLVKFFEAIARGDAEFANGSRLVYPMAGRAMRFLNLVGNKFFALALSAVLGQPVKDSLCGTKALLRRDWIRLRERIRVLGDFDPFGDFNLLFGASLLQLRIRDIPVRYGERTYGTTNINRFADGWLLLRMTAFGLRKLRFARTARRPVTG